MHCPEAMAVHSLKYRLNSAFQTRRKPTSAPLYFCFLSLNDEEEVFFGKHTNNSHGVTTCLVLQHTLDDLSILVLRLPPQINVIRRLPPDAEMSLVIRMLCEENAQLRERTCDPYDDLYEQLARVALDDVVQ